ncbi:hypothetical protein NDU88_000674 [Pleurodeles waltl]|uniref:Uncharacterized protein n=1 Tax=Pleurodeles waltl TaxID=8319 RepID=A0AAV7MLI9_PLEWA|nr:hypothetical protein NDU88_000674 [Pleurodeles waltl]
MDRLRGAWNTWTDCEELGTQGQTAQSLEQMDRLQALGAHGKTAGACNTWTDCEELGTRGQTARSLEHVDRL